MRFSERSVYAAECLAICGPRQHKRGAPIFDRSSHINGIRMNPGPLLAIKLQPPLDTINSGTFNLLFKSIPVALGNHFAILDQTGVAHDWKSGQQFLSFPEFRLVS